jgi:hypothetical protein
MDFFQDLVIFVKKQFVFIKISIFILFTPGRAQYNQQEFSNNIGPSSSASSSSTNHPSSSSGPAGLAETNVTNPNSNAYSSSSPWTPGPTSTLQYTQSMQQPISDVRNHPGYCMFKI